MTGVQHKPKHDHLIQRDKAAIFPEAAVTLTIADQVVRGSTTGSAFTITMPPVAEAKGLIFVIFMVSRSASDDITIADNNGDSDGGDLEAGDITLNADDEYSVLYSDGYAWYELAKNHS